MTEYIITIGRCWRFPSLGVSWLRQTRAVYERQYGSTDQTLGFRGGKSG